VKANRAYRLIVNRGSRRPAWLAGGDRLDRVEVVAVEEGEVAFLWELPAARAARLVRALRTDLAQMEAEEFAAAWREEP